MGRRCGPSTSGLTNPPLLRPQINRPEFPESMRQNFRNPHLFEAQTGRDEVGGTFVDVKLELFPDLVIAAHLFLASYFAG
jgi:hypothetical protein